jgi:hypothetical protein
MHSSAHRVSLVPPRAGRTAFLRQAGQPARSSSSATPCASPNTNRCAAFVCPFRVSARSSLPTRTGHTKAAPSHRAGQPARNATRMERCLFLRADAIPGPAYRRSRPCRPLSPTAISPCACQIQTGARCSIRPVRGSFLADLAPDRFNTAPSLRAGHRRLMSSAHHQTLRADRRDGSYEPTRRTTRSPLTLHSPGKDRSSMSAVALRRRNGLRRRSNGGTDRLPLECGGTARVNTP